MGHIQARPTIEQKVIKCPLCEVAEINVTIISEYMSIHGSHAAGRRSQIPNYHPEKTKVDSNCPNCKATKAEIKEAIERGNSKFKTHEERLQSFKDRGLPLILESKKKD